MQNMITNSSHLTQYIYYARCRSQKNKKIVIRKISVIIKIITTTAIKTIITTPGALSIKKIVNDYDNDYDNNNHNDNHNDNDSNKIMAARTLLKLVFIIMITIMTREEEEA